MDKKLNIEEIQEVSIENEVAFESEVVMEKKKKPLSKNVEAKILMKQAEELIVTADNEVKEVHSVVAEHVSVFEKAKTTLTKGVLSTLSKQLERLNYDYSKEVLDEPFELTLGTNKEKLKVRNVGSGRFSALLYGLIGTLGTAAAWIYFASQKTQTVLDPSLLTAELAENVLVNEKIHPMLTWIGGGMTGGAGNALFGLITLLLSSLFVGFFIYKMRVDFKENKNFKVAHKTLDKTDEYVKNQKESKREIEKIDTHIEALTPLLTDYAVLLEEQSAKLNRVLHVEGEFEESYANSSQEIMRDSEKLIKRVEKLISVPVTKEGHLNEASTYALVEAKATYEGFILKLYNEV